MIIVDTDIWIEHLKASNRQLAILGEALEALVHPYVRGEIALGSLPDRKRLLARFDGMPQPPVARHSYVMQLIEAENLFSSGIGYVRFASDRLDPVAPRESYLDSRPAPSQAGNPPRRGLPAMTQAPIRIGICGWSFGLWRGVFNSQGNPAAAQALIGRP